MTKKRILIVTYYFPPSNNIGALRLKSFAENFLRLGFEPTVVTRHWDGNEETWNDYFAGSQNQEVEFSEGDGYRVIRLPAPAAEARSGPVLQRRFKLVLDAFRGRFQTESDAAEMFRPFLERYLRENEFDYLLVSSPPQNIVRLGSELSTKFRIPLIVDLRDLWNLANVTVRPLAGSRSHRVLNVIQEYYFRKWLAHAKLIAGVSSPITDYVKKVKPSATVAVITNGFERDLFSGIQYDPPSKFLFSSVGTLYPEQDLTVLLEGLRLFLDDKKDEDIQLNFIGAAVRTDMEQFLRSKLPASITHITPRIERAAAVEWMAKSHVLFYAGWTGYRGIYSGKIFEYLGSGNNILIAPTDNDVIEDLIASTKAGKVVDSGHEFASIMNHWFTEWKKTGKASYQGDSRKIAHYTRENQAELLIDAISRIASTHKG